MLTFPNDAGTGLVESTDGAGMREASYPRHLENLGIPDFRTLRQLRHDSEVLSDRVSDVLESLGLRGPLGRAVGRPGETRNPSSERRKASSYFFRRPMGTML